MAQVSGANVIGSFPTFDTRGSVQVFGQLMLRKQAEREAEQKELARSLASLKTDGLRERDKDKYYKNYDLWRTKKQEAYTLKKGQAKFNADADAAKLEQQLNEFVAQSKAKTARDAPFIMEQIKNPHLFSPEGKLLSQKSFDAVTGEDGDITDYTKIPLGHDFSKIPTKFNTLDDQVMQTKSRFQSIPEVNNGKGLLIQQNIREGDPVVQKLAYLNNYEADDEIKAFIQQSYPDLDWIGNEAQAKAIAVEDMVKQRPLVREETPSRRTDPDYIDKLEAERLKLSKSRAARVGSGTTSTDVRRSWIQDIRDGEPNALEKLVAAGNGSTEYSKKDRFEIRSSDPTKVTGKFILHVPPKTSIGGKAYDYPIDRSSPNFETFMNQLIGDITGARVDLGSVGARSSNLKKSPPSTEVKSLSKTAPANTPDIVTFTEGGTTYNIPKDKVASFLKAKPKAKRQ